MIDFRSLSAITASRLLITGFSLSFVSNGKTQKSIPQAPANNSGDSAVRLTVALFPGGMVAVVLSNVHFQPLGI